MPEAPSLIMIQFLAWMADRPRNYAQTMDAWRSTCPRLSVWEDAVIEGLVKIESDAARTVRLTPRGRALLAQAQADGARPDAGLDAEPDARAATASHIHAGPPAIVHAAAL